MTTTNKPKFTKRVCTKCRTEQEIREGHDACFRCRTSPPPVTIQESIRRFKEDFPVGCRVRVTEKASPRGRAKTVKLCGRVTKHNSTTVGVLWDTAQKEEPAPGKFAYPCFSQSSRTGEQTLAVELVGVDSVPDQDGRPVRVGDRVKGVWPVPGPTGTVVKVGGPADDVTLTVRTENHGTEFFDPRWVEKVGPVEPCLCCGNDDPATLEITHDQSTDRWYHTCNRCDTAREI